MEDKYITYREEIDGDLQYFILQKEFPHFCCYISDKPIVNFIQPLPISSYDLWLVFNFTLRGNMIPSYKDIYDEICAVMTDMGLWFYSERILTNPKKYKKWKIHQ